MLPSRSAPQARWEPACKRVDTTRMNPAPFKEAAEWDQIAARAMGLQVEAVTGMLCLAEGLPVNSSDQFFMACHPDSGRVQNVTIFPGAPHFTDPGHVRFNNHKNSGRHGSRLVEVGRDKALYSRRSSEAIRPRGKLEYLLAAAWHRLETDYPAVLKWRRKLYLDQKPSRRQNSDILDGRRLTPQVRYLLVRFPRPLPSWKRCQPVWDS